MKRRDFIKLSSVAAGSLILPGCMQSQLKLAQNQGMALPRPNPAQLAWQQAEIGLVYHYDLHVFDKKQYGQGRNRRTPITNIDMFNPTQYSTDQWIEAARAMGAKFAILTACHETGFRLWQSDVNPYSMKALKWQNGKGDIVKDFINSCRKYNIKPGIYIGARWNSHLKVLNFKVQPGSSVTQTQYNKLIEQEVTELWTQYGPLFEVWFDGGILTPDKGGPDVLPIFEKYQPNCLFYHSAQRSDARWGGSESGTVGDPCWSTMPFKGSRGHINKNLLKHGDPDGKYWSPAMADAPLRNHEWFWEPDNERKLYSINGLLNIYYKSVGQNATLIMGATPDDRGLIPDADFKRMSEFGKEIKKRFAKPAAKTHGIGEVVELKLSQPTTLNHVIIKEDIKYSERVREYTVEGLTNTNQWKTLFKNQCIGHKRICKFDPIKLSAVRVNITKSSATPIIHELSVFNAG